VRTAGWSRNASAPTAGSEASMFIGQALRRAPKPLCISAQTLRARARARGSVPQSCFSGNCSARVSAMASVSHTAKPSSSTSTGTLPTGFCAATACLKAEPASNESKRTMTSSNGMPTCFISTHGRMDQEE
jgi:hypothetical protein